VVFIVCWSFYPPFLLRVLCCGDDDILPRLMGHYYLVVPFPRGWWWRQPASSPSESKRADALCGKPAAPNHFEKRMRRPLTRSFASLTARVAVREIPSMSTASPRSGNSAPFVVLARPLPLFFFLLPQHNMSSLPQPICAADRRRRHFRVGGKANHTDQRRSFPDAC
jgi:hypothetical protein